MHRRERKREEEKKLGFCSSSLLFFLALLFHERCYCCFCRCCCCCCWSPLLFIRDAPSAEEPLFCLSEIFHTPSHTTTPSKVKTRNNNQLISTDFISTSFIRILSHVTPPRGKKSFSCVKIKSQTKTKNAKSFYTSQKKTKERKRKRKPLFFSHFSLFLLLLDHFPNDWVLELEFRPPVPQVVHL